MTEMISVPDGKGGWMNVPAGTQVTVDVKKQEEAMAKAVSDDFFDRVGKCTVYLNKVMRNYAKEHGLTRQEAAAAVYLENCNNRFFFPEEDGGQAEFDRISTAVWTWFRDQAK